MGSLGSKPEAKKESFNKDADPKEFNPFLPPFQEGLFISDITEHHRLLFNKYSVCDEHVLVVTKEFEKQVDGL